MSLVLVAACVERAARTSQLPTGVRGTFPYEPERISVHPLTRYWVSPTGDLEVEARIELLDPDGYPARGIGRLELDLESQNGRRVETWILVLSDPEINRSHFDDVTRTYLVRLSLPNNDIPEGADLVATLVLPDGDRLVGSGRINKAPVPLEPSSKPPQDPINPTED
ncbi:MAG: hypothetical protein P8M22_04980 [Phycisphaerales bacterium]|nr:hypothetical protein [Phycisphaerales bacterium]